MNPANNIISTKEIQLNIVELSMLWVPPILLTLFGVIVFSNEHVRITSIVFFVWSIYQCYRAIHGREVLVIDSAVHAKRKEDVIDDLILESKWKTVSRDSNYCYLADYTGFIPNFITIVFDDYAFYIHSMAEKGGSWSNRSYSKRIASKIKCLLNEISNAG